MIFLIAPYLRAIIIVVIIVIIFISVTIINLKIKRPKVDNKDCETCLNRDGCPIIIKEEDKEESGEEN